MRNPISRWIDNRRQLARHHAANRSAFHQHSLDVAAMTNDLAGTAAPHARWALLELLSSAENCMATARVQGWRDMPQRSLGGQPLSVVLRYQAKLHWLIADAERAIAEEVQRRSTTSLLEDTAGPVLDRAVAARRIGRSVLVELADAATPLVGMEAASAARSLPLPVEEPDPAPEPLYEWTPQQLAAAGITYALEDEAPTYRDRQGRELHANSGAPMLPTAELCDWCEHHFTTIARGDGRTDHACDDHRFWLNRRQRGEGYNEQPPTRMTGGRSDYTVAG